MIRFLTGKSFYIATYSRHYGTIRMHTQVSEELHWMSVCAFWITVHYSPLPNPVSFFYWLLIPNKYLTPFTKKKKKERNSLYVNTGVMAACRKLTLQNNTKLCNYLKWFLKDFKLLNIYCIILNEITIDNTFVRWVRCMYTTKINTQKYK